MTTQLNGQFDLSSAQEGVALPATTDIASFTDANHADDPSAFTATIDWGDGNTSTGTVMGSNGSFSVEGAHTYADEAFENASVTIVRTADSSQLVLTGTVPVDDSDTLNGHSAPTISGNPNQALTNVTVATFSDPTYPNNVASDFTVSIDWGDGTTTGGTISGGSGTFTVSGSHTYGTAGEFTITTFMNDDFPDAAAAVATTTAAMGFGGTETLQSATEFTAVASGTEVAVFADNTGLPSTDYTAMIDWGDGTTTAGSVSGSNGSFTVTSAVAHSYADEGLFTLSANITRTTDHATAAATGTVTVADADVLNATGTTIHSADQPLTNVTVATFSDTITQNVASDFVATINWGDGTTSTGVISGSAGAFTVTGSHTYAQNGEDSITVDVADIPRDSVPTASAEAQTTAIVGVAPGTGDTFSVAEGVSFVDSQIATFSDGNTSDTAGAFTASINWGDGTTTTGTVFGSNGSFVVSGGPHTWADEGVDAVTTTVTRTADHEQATMTGQATVTEADSFSINPGGVTGNPGVPFTNVPVATFTDTYTGQVAGDLSAVINWGDGTTAAGTISGGNGSFTVDGSHTYTTGGNYNLSVTVSDDAPGTATDTGVAPAIINFAGQMQLTSAAEHVALAGNTQIATFSDSNGGDTAGSFTATINWGDGTTTAGTVVGSGGSFTVEGGHTYADEGNDQVGVTVTHTADMSQSMFSGNVAVAEHDVFTPQGGGVTLHGSQASLAATFGDTDTGNTAGDFTSTIDWGDGQTTTGTVSGGNGSFTVSGSHTYASSNAFLATVTLTDDAPGTATSSQTVPVNPPPPAGTSADLIADQPSTGAYQIYDFGNNSLLASHPLTNIPAPWQVVGLGNFSGSGTSDMLLRNMTTGSFEIVDVNNNTASAPIPLGNVGLEVQVAGFGDFSSRPGETDMLMRNTNNGDFELYDFSNNTVTSATPLGNVGLDLQVFGFGDFSGKPNETDMLLRDVKTDNVELVEFSNNAVTSVTQLGNLGSEWQFAGAGDFSSRPGETDLLARNVNTGDFELYDFQNGHVTAAFALGNVGLEIQVVGFADFSGNPNETDMLLRDTNNGNLEIVDFRNNAVAGVTLPGNVSMNLRTDGTAPFQATGSATTAFDSGGDPIAGAAPVAALAMPNPLQTHTG